MRLKQFALFSGPAIVLMAPLMFPIAKGLGINDVHYSMVVVTAMNIGLMTPPVGVGFYLACKIGNVSPDEAIGAIPEAPPEPAVAPEPALDAEPADD